MYTRAHWHTHDGSKHIYQASKPPNELKWSIVFVRRVFVFPALLARPLRLPIGFSVPRGERDWECILPSFARCVSLAMINPNPTPLCHLWKMECWNRFHRFRLGWNEERNLACSCTRAGRQWFLASVSVCKVESILLDMPMHWKYC